MEQELLNLINSHPYLYVRTSLFSAACWQTNNITSRSPQMDCMTYLWQSPSDNRRSLQVDGLSEHAKGLQTGRHANIISPLTCCNAHQTDTLTCMMSFFLAAEIYTCRLLNLCARNLIVHTALNSCPCAIILFAHDYIFTRQFLHKHNLSYCCYRLVYNLLNHGLFLVL